jgi:hypothetical protein
MSTPATTPAADGTAQPRRRVPRWVWFVAVCVALGAMTSVGVAWAWMFLPFPRPKVWNPMPARGPVILELAQDVHPGLYDQIYLEFETRSNAAVTRSDFHAGSQNRYWHGDASRQLPDLYGRVTNNEAFRQAVHRHEALMLSPYRYAVRFSVVLAGWPLHCLAFEDACTPKESWGSGGPRVLVYDVKTGAMTASAIEFDPLGNLKPFYHAIEIGDNQLPIFPLWPGLLANTAIYGGAWAVLLGVPVLLRRWLRARRGGCPQCGYSREGLKVDAPCPECGRTPPAAHDATPAPAAPIER